MERLSHDLNLALEESNCGRQERRRLGLRRRTRSAGSLPAAVTVSLVEDGSSSSPPQAPLITQPLSDSDDPHLNLHKSSLKSRHYCHIGNFESDSFNENFSPTRPANARRKRKYKKVPVEYSDGKRSPPIEILSVTTEPNAFPIMLPTVGLSPNRHKVITKPERNAFCGKRKWAHRDKGDGCEMRERSFSGGCSSKSAFFKNDFKTRKYDPDLFKRDTVLQPGKIVLQSQNTEGASPSTFTNTPSLPGSSSFNFVYKNSSKNGTPTLSKMTGYKIPTDLPPFFSPTTSSGKNSFDGKYYRKLKLLNKSYPPNSLRNPLQFDDSNSGMDFAGNESSSLSSSDSDGVVTNDSDREGDDELTDWPGIEELKVFNKSLTFKSSKTVNSQNPVSSMPPPKRLKKEKQLVKGGWASCKNRFKKKRAKVDSGNDDDAMMSDSKTVVNVDDEVVSKENRDILQPHSSFSSFSDVKNAGVSGQNANESFFQSFLAFQAKTAKDEAFSQTPRTNFTLQKTSSSDLNLSEKSPQSDHYCSEHSMGNAGVTEVREIRAGCRRIREERPGFLILSAANEQLSRFLQDSCQTELKLPSFHDPEEKEKLESLAKLYSLELQVEMGRPVLRKTSNTMQAVRVEHSYHNFPSDHKRRCYGDETDTSFSLSDQNSVTSIPDAVDMAGDGSKIRHLTDNFTHTECARPDRGEHCGFQRARGDASAAVDRDYLNVPGVYRIPCDCGNCYVGETRRNITTRLTEHIRSIKNMHTKSAVAEHALLTDTNHFIRFDKASVLAREKFLIPRKVREAIEIVRHPNNRDRGWTLSSAWVPVLSATSTQKGLGSLESDTVSAMCSGTIADVHSDEEPSPLGQSSTPSETTQSTAGPQCAGSPPAAPRRSRRLSRAGTHSVRRDPAARTP